MLVTVNKNVVSLLFNILEHTASDPKLQVKTGNKDKNKKTQVIKSRREREEMINMKRFLVIYNNVTGCA